MPDHHASLHFSDVGCVSGNFFPNKLTKKWGKHQSTANWDGNLWLLALMQIIHPVEMVTERGSSLESSKDFKSIYSLFKFFFFFWILSTKWNVFFHFYRICGWPSWLTWKHLIQNGLNPGRTDTRLTCWKWLQLCWRSKSNMLIVLGLRWWWWPFCLKIADANLS